MCGRPVAPAVSRPPGCGQASGWRAKSLPVAQGAERSGACGPEAVWREGWRQALERCGRETLGSRKPWKSLTLRGQADGRRGRGHQAPQARCLVEMSVLVVVDWWVERWMLPFGRTYANGSSGPARP